MKKRLHWASIVRVTKRLFLNESLLSKLDYISKYVKCLFMTLVSAMNKSVKSQAFIRSRVQNFPLFAPDFFTGQLFSFKIPTCPRFPQDKFIRCSKYNMQNVLHIQILHTYIHTFFKCMFSTMWNESMYLCEKAFQITFSDFSVSSCYGD